MKRRALLISILIAIAGALLLIPGIGSARLFDWDEINFAESAREMLVTGDWFNVRINFEPFWEKPPLFIWAQALSMKLFGVGEFAARFPNAIIGIITLLLLFNIGRRVEDERFGLMWTLMYGVSMLPFFYFKSGIIDPWFNLFIFLGIYFFSRYAETPGPRPAALSAMFLGLAVMTKGPVGFLIFALTFAVWIAVRRFRFTFRWKDVALFVAVFALVGGSWFIALALSGHSDVIADFIRYQVRLFETKDAGHGGFLLYHFVILFLGVTPASIFALSALWKIPGRAGNDGQSNQVGPDAGRVTSEGTFTHSAFWEIPGQARNDGQSNQVGPDAGRVPSDGISPVFLPSGGTLPESNGANLDYQTAGTVPPDCISPVFLQSGGTVPESQRANLKTWMTVSFWVVLILFTIVRTKIVHYSSFCYFPLSYLGAWAACRMMDGQLKFRRWHSTLLIVLSAGYGLVLTALTLFDNFKDRIIPYVQDPFAVSCMEASSDWKGFEPLVGLVLTGATVAFCIYFRRTLKARSFAILAAGNLFFAMTAILCAVPEVEKYSQASAVDFYIGRQGEDCYVQPAYFKSYAQYFYTAREESNKCDDFDFLCRGELDKPCYFVVKDIPADVQRLRDDAPEAKLLYRKSGFLFFKRECAPDQEQQQDGEGEQQEIE